MTLHQRHVVRGGLQRCHDDGSVMGEMEYTTYERCKGKMLKKQTREFGKRSTVPARQRSTRRQLRCNRFHVGGANSRARKCTREQTSAEVLS